MKSLNKCSVSIPQPRNRRQGTQITLRQGSGFAKVWQGVGESLGTQSRPQMRATTLGYKGLEGDHLWPPSHSTSRTPSAGASVFLIPASHRGACQIQGHGRPGQ